MLVGPSGSGKSTLCMLLNGIIPQILGGKLTGTVTVDGQDVSNTPVQELAKSTGMLFQDPEWMFATLKVEDVGVDRAEERDLANEAEPQEQRAERRAGQQDGDGGQRQLGRHRPDLD